MLTFNTEKKLEQQFWRSLHTLSQVSAFKTALILYIQPGPLKKKSVILYRVYIMSGYIEQIIYPHQLVSNLVILKFGYNEKISWPFKKNITSGLDSNILIRKIETLWIKSWQKYTKSFKFDGWLVFNTNFSNISATNVYRGMNKFYEPI